MTELRSKMIKSMELGNLSKNTQRSYLKAVSGLAKHYKKPPDNISKNIERVRWFQSDLNIFLYIW